VEEAVRMKDAITALLILAAGFAVVALWALFWGLCTVVPILLALWFLQAIGCVSL
jgi:hypothetical protein